MCNPAYSHYFTFVFYNVENLFDTKNDTLSDDDEFTPNGEKYWKNNKYQAKLENIARVLRGVGQWELPAIVGLCEVENKNVLYDLSRHRLINDAEYHLIHKDSPDRRGIDVAMLYREEVFQPLKSRWISILFESDPERTTRDILYVKGTINDLDTLHIFINHWPSRWGGIEASQPRRIEAARKLKQLTDSIYLADINPNILIAGDFNDNPTDSSLHKVLQAGIKSELTADGLVNLMLEDFNEGETGTLKYRESWETYDQIIISSSMYYLRHTQLTLNGAFVYAPDYLLIEDERYLGKKPFRTYIGPRYQGGFSDHLPVYIRFEKASKSE